MNSHRAILLLSLSLSSLNASAIPRVQEPIRVEVWSHALSARTELKARESHFEMTIRKRGGLSTWKQIHSKDAELLVEKLNSLEALVIADEGIHQIKTAACHSGWVRVRPEQPNEWKTCLDQPISGMNPISIPAQQAYGLAHQIADGFAKIVNAPEAPAVLRTLARNDPPAPLIEDSAMVNIEAEIEAADSDSQARSDFENSRQERMQRQTSDRDPFMRTDVRPGRTPVPTEMFESSATREPASTETPSRYQPTIKLRPAPGTAREPVKKKKREAAVTTVQNKIEAETRKLEDLFKSVQQYVQATPALILPQKPEVEMPARNQQASVLPRSLRQRKPVPRQLDEAKPARGREKFPRSAVGSKNRF